MKLSKNVFSTSELSPDFQAFWSLPLVSPIKVRLHLERTKIQKRKMTKYLFFNINEKFGDILFLNQVRDTDRLRIVTDVNILLGWAEILKVWGVWEADFSCISTWMHRGAKAVPAPHVYSFSLLSLALKMDDFHIIPALAMLIWCGFHSFSCKFNRLMDGYVYPPQISTFLPSPPPS